MRVMVISTPLDTHFMPMVPLAWALKAAGHEVMVMGQPEIVAAANAAGLPAIRVGDRFDMLEFIRVLLPRDRRLIEIGMGRVPADGWGELADMWLTHAKYLTGPYLEYATAWRPDLILADPLELASLIVGGALGVPTVHHRWGAERLSTAVLLRAKRMLHERAVRLGAAAGVPEPTLVLEPLPASLGLPGIEPGDPIRPVPYNAGGQIPEWAAQRGASRRVCVSFGNMMLPGGNGLSLYRHVADAFDELADTEAILTLDPAVAEQLGTVPAGVHLVGRVPLATFLGTCDAVVHHGGAGTTLTAMPFGVPHALLPQGFDHYDRAQQIADAGAGLVLDEASTQNDPAAIRDLLESLMVKPQYQEAAHALREEAERMPSPAEVAARLTDLTA